MWEGRVLELPEKYTRRDWLARDRTHLANERTVLAYWRTSFALMVLGACLIKFFPTTESLYAAGASMLAGVALLAYGTQRFLKYKKRINHR